MQEADRTEFLRLVDELCAAFDKPPSKELHSAFWKGCGKMPIRLFRLGVEHALEHHEGRMPSPKQISRYAHDARSDQVKRERNAALRQQLDAADKQPYWLGAVNSLFLRWMWNEIKHKQRPVFIGEVMVQKSDGSQQIKLLPRSIPDGELRQRRQACRQLAEDFALFEREGDPQANRRNPEARAYLEQCFAQQMALITAENPA